MLSRVQIARRAPASLQHIRRWLATEAPGRIEETEEQQRQRYQSFLAGKEKEPPLRPQLNVEVNPSHGLYAFFRKVPSQDGVDTVYETVQSTEQPGTKMGRSWNATELRRKSFKDLHTLWYIVLRERNLLATQQAESKRLGVMSPNIDSGEKDKRCRKTMARIKTILNERRLAYEQAYAIEHEQYKANEARAAQEKQASGAESETGATSAEPTQNDTTTRGRRLRRSRGNLASANATSELSVEAAPTPTPTPVATA